MTLNRSIRYFSVMGLIGPPLQLAPTHVEGMSLRFYHLYFWTLHDLRDALSPAFRCARIWFGDSIGQNTLSWAWATGLNVVMFAGMGAVLYVLRKSHGFWIYVVLFALLLTYPLALPMVVVPWRATTALPVLLAVLTLYAAGVVIVRRDSDVPRAPIARV